MTTIDTSADVRIEIMQALLNNANVSGEAFAAIANLFNSVEGKDDDAWAVYKNLFNTTNE